ncbi:cell division protein ZapE [Labrys wisconsinensis]|uniref:Cell division protein ZapE n=1 Tax=Labrys wisconsinensis TaxID=425677 RepID=A0ABU0JLE7_9HYPH|nr:cell division protein ZapE [Labrys wisconsinensis]MDQ0475115.1 cell division protein ZapE [Labrys wisconsinensis]
MRTAYAALVASGEIEADPAQQAVVERLDALVGRLNERASARKGGALARLFGRAPPKEAPKGLYIWGSVGRGKTMLMDLFYEHLPPALPRRRVHFNAFMNDVHERIFRHRNAVKAGQARGDDPIPPVAAALAAEAGLLCFDEFSVTDIADAMLLGRLFTRLFEDGVVVVATSNVEPDRLYEGGLNRALFVPFIDLLKRHMEIVKLEARTDYRREKLAGGATYVVATGAPAKAALDAAFQRLTGVARGKPRILIVKGRELVIPEAEKGVARASFDALCREPLGPADTLAIAQAFHTLVLDAVPVLGEGERNAAKRFITLIDSLYDAGAKLVVSAAAEPDGLYPAGEGREAFEFQRTASRLVEMRSEDYLARPHNAGAPKPGIVET